MAGIEDMFVLGITKTLLRIFLETIMGTWTTQAADYILSSPLDIQLTASCFVSEEPLKQQLRGCLEERH